MLDRARDNEKIRFLTDAKVTAVQGEKSVESLLVENTVTGAVSTLEVTGLFVALAAARDGHDFVAQALEKGADGLIAVAAGAGGHAGVLSPLALISVARKAAP